MCSTARTAFFGTICARPTRTSCSPCISIWVSARSAGERNPEVNRTHKIAEYLNVSYYAIKRYDFKEPLDIIYYLLWLDELIPNYHLDLRDVKDLDNESINIIKKFLIELDSMRNKRKKKEIKYIDYIEWKLTYTLGDNHE